MSSKKWFFWLLPFGDKCDPRCEDRLHDTYCIIFSPAIVVLFLFLTGFLSKAFLSEFFSLNVVLMVFLAFFAATWEYQKKITMYFYCRRCLVKEKEMKGNSVHCGAEPILVKSGYLFLSFLGVVANLERDECLCFRCGSRFAADQLGVEALG